MSSYKGLDLFGSGPHRVGMVRHGNLTTVAHFEGGTGAGSSSHGVFDVEIVVRGRLVAASEAALWTLRSAVRAQVAHPVSRGTFIDNAGRSWSDMSLIRYAEGPERDFGRTWSVAYEARFRAMTG